MLNRVFVLDNLEDLSKTIIHYNEGISFKAAHKTKLSTMNFLWIIFCERLNYPFIFAMIITHVDNLINLLDSFTAIHILWINL